MPIQIAVMSRKGGVGKTTSAVHLAGLLSRKYSTLLIDGDPRRYARTWAKDMPFDVGGLGDMMRRNDFEALVVDTQADPSEDDIASLGLNCTHVLLPVEPERQSVSGLAQTVAVLDGAKVPRERVYVLLTMDTRRGTATQEAREVIEGQGLRVLKRAIRDTVAFRHASGEGKLVYQVGSESGRLAWSDYTDVYKEMGL